MHISRLRHFGSRGLRARRGSGVFEAEARLSSCVDSPWCAVIRCMMLQAVVQPGQHSTCSVPSQCVTVVHGTAFRYPSNNRDTEKSEQCCCLTVLWSWSCLQRRSHRSLPCTESPTSRHLRTTQTLGKEGCGCSRLHILILYIRPSWHALSVCSRELKTRRSCHVDTVAISVDDSFAVNGC